MYTFLMAANRAATPQPQACLITTTEEVRLKEMKLPTELYATKTVPHLEEDLTLPVDAYRQPEAPWS
jgi:hypothetical protein